MITFFSRLKNRVGGYHRDTWFWLCGAGCVEWRGPKPRVQLQLHLTSSSHVSGRLCLGLRRSRRSEACTAYDLAGIYMAQGRVYGVQHVRGHDPGPGDHGTLSARERANPPGGSGAGGKLRHPIWQKPSKRAISWHKSKRTSLALGRSCSVTSRGNPSTAPRTIWSSCAVCTARIAGR